MAQSLFLSLDVFPGLAISPLRTKIWLSFFQAEDGIRDPLWSRGLGDVYKRQLYQKPGRRPPPITRRFVNTVTREWVGAHNGRAPLRFHGAVVVFVARCLSRTRNLAASNNDLAEFFSSRSWPKIGPSIVFFGVFEK